MTGIGRRIRQARERRRMTQDELAKALGVTRGAVSGWELERWTVDARHLPSLARALGVDLDWLVTGRGEIPAPLGVSKELARALTSLRQITQAIRQRLLPVVGLAYMGDHDWAEHPVEEPSGYVPAPADVPESALGVRVEGDSMAGFGLHAGSVLIVVPFSGPPRDGDLLVVRYPGRAPEVVYWHLGRAVKWPRGRAPVEADVEDGMQVLARVLYSFTPWQAIRRAYRRV